MEKIRTIYRLRMLRGGLLLSVITILWGLGLFTYLKVIPGGMNSHLKTIICDSNKITTETQMDGVYDKLQQADNNFSESATNAITLGVMSVVFLLVIIRLNGKILIRKVISWLMGIGVFLYAVGDFYSASNFVNSPDLNMYNTNQWMVIPGIVLLFFGVLLAVIKIISDLTESIGID